MKSKKFLYLIPLLCMIMLNVISICAAWSNKGNSEDKDYGTHDWIADHALQSMLRTVNNTSEISNYEWITANMKEFFLGTEAPDNPLPKIWGENIFDYWDQLNHHNYYESYDVMVEDYASERAQQEFTKAINALQDGDWRLAAFYAGTMAHYLGDLSNYMHVMGSDSPLGKEIEGSHSKYEKEIRSATDSLQDTFFNISYAPVVKLNFTNAAYEIGRQIGWYSHQQARWMNEHFQADFSLGHATTEFELRTQAALNYAINLLASLIFTLGFYSEAEDVDNRWHLNYRSIPFIALIGLGSLCGLIIGFRIRRNRKKADL